jgi:hypothetical protein
MNRLSRSPYLLLGVLVLLCSGLTWAQSGESLGDVARKTKDEAATGKKAAKVFTEDDIPASASVSAPASSSSSASATATDNPASDSKDAKGKAADAKSAAPEDPEKAEERKAQMKLADGYEQDAKDLQRKYKALQERYDNETDPFRKMVMENELANSKDNVAGLQKKADDLRKQAQGGGSADATAQPAGQQPNQQPSQPPQ